MEKERKERDWAGEIWEIDGKGDKRNREKRQRHFETFFSFLLQNIRSQKFNFVVAFLFSV